LILSDDKIIIRCNVWFDEKSSRVKLLNASSGLLQDAPFDVVLDTGSPAPLFSPSTGPSNFLPISTRPSISESTSPTSSVSTGPPTAEPLTSDQPTEVNHSSPISCLPRWDAKTIEAVGADVGDASCG
jgi:hypothetical protein